MKNASNIETIDFQRHAKLRIKPSPDFVHAKEANLVPVTMGELGACIGNFPVVFIPIPDNGMRPMALLGLRPGENIYYGPQTWESAYIPRMIQVHPFVIAFDDRLENSMTVTACIDRSSASISEDEGIALFTPTGEETEYVGVANQLLKEIYESEQVTGQFIRKLRELDLIAPFDLIVQPKDGEARRITGMFQINEGKLRELESDKLLELHKLDFLAPAYMILASMFQMPRLLRLRNKMQEEQITDYLTEMAKPQPAAQ